MPLLRLNADHDSVRLHRSAQPVAGALSRVAGGDGPIIVMITGFSYQPNRPKHCPHRLVLGLPGSESGRDAPSWPRGLGFGLGIPGEGLAIAFGWNARGSIWRARRRAIAAGRALAEVVAAMRERAPHRRVNILAHSMGIEVATAALPYLPAGSVSRIISLTGAIYQSSVIAALNSPAGREVDFFNVVSRSNALFDTLYERLIAPPNGNDRAIGRGLDGPNILTLDLDCTRTLGRLAQLGTPIAPPARRVCHWSAYTRPGALHCYGAWMREPERHALAMLRTRLAQPGSAVRTHRRATAGIGIGAVST